MKKIFALVLALTMLLSLSLVATAAFVPSINEKPAPPASSDDPGCGEDNCIIVTPVSDPEASDDLKDAYKDLDENGTDDLDSDFQDPVVRDLFEISGCEHAADKLEKDGEMDIDFDLGLDEGEELEAYTYVNGAWRRLPVKVGADGTATVTINEFGVIAFLVEAGKRLPVTGDFDHMNVLWISLMAVSLATIPMLVKNYKKQNKKASEEA